MTHTPSHNAAQTGSSPLLKIAVMMLLPLIVGIIVACGDSGGATQQAARGPYEGIPEGTPRGLGSSVPDPPEKVETVAAGQLPQFLSSLTGNDLKTTTALYQGAMDHVSDFEHIPCYCGCAIYAHPHDSLRACFIKEKSADGQIVFTDHSTSCSLCQEAAQMTIDGLAQKTPLKEVRANIFSKLKYTDIWTDTDPVQ